MLLFIAELVVGVPETRVRTRPALSVTVQHPATVPVVAVVGQVPVPAVSRTVLYVSNPCIDTFPVSDGVP
jgi:hypothetical protein